MGTSDFHGPPKRCIRLGVVGLSEGNGHPYSWSAICNGYNPEAMLDCGFPVIPQYLQEQQWPQAQIPNARVTHVWTQDTQLTAKIADAACIPNVCQNLEEVAEGTDAILLARDDGENHYEMSRPFLERGKYIFIDKPLANSVSDAKKILQHQAFPGQVFSCSALKYAPEIRKSLNRLTQDNHVRHLYAYTPKSWLRYGMHLIDTATQFIPTQSEIVANHALNSGSSTTLTLEWTAGLTTTFVALGHLKSKMGIKIFADSASQEIIFEDAFTAFRTALETFVSGILDGRPRITEEEMLRSVRILELGTTTK